MTIVLTDEDRDLLVEALEEYDGALQEAYPAVDDLVERRIVRLRDLVVRLRSP